MKFGVIVIGRNEGERLKRCLQSVSSAAAIVYVDSGSTDGSAKWVRDQHIEVVELDMSLPFTAARARNAGFRHLRLIAPDLFYVQFVDGDCELSASWPECAVSFLESHTDIGAVCGTLRERFPQQSVYNWLCDREWDGPAGEVRATGGIVMIRMNAFDTVGGYREDVIAAEDDELCFRMRATGWRIWRLGCEMGIHDAAMTRFDQWWQRSIRTGYAFAQGAYLHGASPEHHFVWESRRAWLWGVWLPLVCLFAGLMLGSWGWAVVFIYPLQMLRQAVRNPGELRDRARLSVFQVLGRFPEGWGQVKFLCDRLLRRQPRLIEYK
jgi:GT2 family glycosyltransferase